MVLPLVASAGAPWVATPVTTAYPLHLRLRHPSTAVMIGGHDDLYMRIFGAPRRSFDPRLCDSFDCFEQNADTKVLIRYPMEQLIWASATGHDRLAPCGGRSDLLSTFERYDGCDTFLRRADRVTVVLEPRRPDFEVNDDAGRKDVPGDLDRRPAAVPDAAHGSRGANRLRERSDRR